MLYFCITLHKCKQQDHCAACAHASPSIAKRGLLTDFAMSSYYSAQAQAAGPWCFITSAQLCSSRGAQHT
eukprot:1157816-Pelagomonas_calceolata.AAC.5